MKINKLTKAMLMASVAVAFTSCESEELLEEGSTSQNTIDFTTYLKSTTRASIINTDSIKTQGFKVVAYKTSGHFAATTDSPNFMQDVTVSYGEDGWSYNPVQYWPTDNTEISFFAYAPANKKSYGDERGSRINATKCGYDVVDAEDATKIDAAQTFDLISAQNLNCTRANTNKVALTFSHATSRIDVQVKTSNLPEKNVYVYVTGMEFSGNKFYTAGTYDFYTETWSDKTSDGSVTYSMEDLMCLKKQDKLSGSEKGILLSEDYSGLFKNATESLLSKKDYFFTIPTGLASESATSGDFKVNLTYKVLSKDAISSTSDKTVYFETEYSKEFDLKTVFVQGKAYCLNFDIDLADNEIKLDDITVTPWDDVTSDNEDIDDTDTSEDNNAADTFVHYYLYGSNAGLSWDGSKGVELTLGADGWYTATLETVDNTFMVGTWSNAEFGLKWGSTQTMPSKAGEEEEFAVGKGSDYGLAFNAHGDKTYKNVTVKFKPSSETAGTVKLKYESKE